MMITNEKFLELQKSMYKRANMLKRMGYTRLLYVGQYSISLADRSGNYVSLWINLDENCLEEQKS